MHVARFQRAEPGDARAPRHLRPAARSRSGQDQRCGRTEQSHKVGRRWMTVDGRQRRTRRVARASLQEPRDDEARSVDAGRLAGRTRELGQASQGTKCSRGSRSDGCSLARGDCGHRGNLLAHVGWHESRVRFSKTVRRQVGTWSRTPQLAEGAVLEIAGHENVDARSRWCRS